MAKQDIVLEWGLYDFDVDEDGFTPEFYGDILEDPFRRG
jgi:hypothetical protein